VVCIVFVVFNTLGAKMFAGINLNFKATFVDQVLQDAVTVHRKKVKV